MLAEIDILLNLEQYKMAVPSALACYLSHGTFIVYETIVLAVSDIIGLTQNPLSLLRGILALQLCHKCLKKSDLLIT